MAWSDPRELREDLRRELRDVRRELEDLKRGLASKHAAHTREIEALRTKSDTAFERLLRTFKRHALEQKAGLDRKWDGQPHDELGRFDFGKKPKPELVSQPAAMRPRGPERRRNRRASRLRARGPAKLLPEFSSLIPTGARRKVQPRATTPATTR